MDLAVSMPSHIEKAYDVWRFQTARNLKKTSELCGVPYATIHGWRERYHWYEAAADTDILDRKDAIGNAWARLAADLDHDVSVLQRASRSVYGHDGRPVEGDPTPTALKAAGLKLAILGLAPQRQVSVDVTTTQRSFATDAELQALLDAGDVDQLLALALGRPTASMHAGTDTMPASVAASVSRSMPDTSYVTPPISPPPPDFTRDQLGGRVGPGSLQPDSADGDADMLDADVLDAVFREP